MESRGVWKVEVPSISWGCLGGESYCQTANFPQGENETTVC